MTNVILSREKDTGDNRVIIHHAHVINSSPVNVRENAWDFRFSVTLVHNIAVIIKHLNKNIIKIKNSMDFFLWKQC